MEEVIFQSLQGEVNRCGIGILCNEFITFLKIEASEGRDLP